MKPRHTRLVRYVLFILILGSGAFLVLWSLWGELSFYQTPTQVNAHLCKTAGSSDVLRFRAIRLGGYVKKGSVRTTRNAFMFRVYDAQTEIPVIYTGAVPQLFQEEQGVVLDGSMSSNGVFHATRVLAKHDEVYTSNRRTKDAGQATVIQ